jgi:acetolactate synthase-1/2/3 large subunit
MKGSKMVNAADYVLGTIERTGVKHVFGVTGGAITVQLDAFSRNKKVKYIAMQHEQAAAMAVEAYARINGYGVAMSTSGPGGTNLITGICGCWFDSIPALFITGQVSTFDLKTNGVRQQGFQEVDMSALMKPVTKFSKMIVDAKDLPKYLEEAILESKSGRFGPVHLDLPMDVQQSTIKYKKIRIAAKRLKTKIDLKKALRLISEAKRPVLILGNGVRLAGAVDEFVKLADKLQWPILPSWAFANFAHKNRIELFGVYGNRGANFTVQNADLILAIGTRLDTRMTGSNPKQFAREAKKIIVDIDREELKKKIVIPDVAINSDAKEFLTKILKSKIKNNIDKDWLLTCKKWRDEYQIIKNEDVEKGPITPYNFSRLLSQEAGPGDIVVAECGGNLAWMMQMWEFKKNQLLFSSYGNSPMGYGLPAAIGAYFATGKPIICTVGDGGLQMNIQELQTVVNYDIPIKIFVFNNEGYGIIRQFQDLYLGGRHVGTHEKVPDFKKIGTAYGIKGMRIEKMSELRKGIKEALSFKKAVIVDVMMDPKAVIEPRAIFKKPIEEQSPFLPDEEVLKHLKVARWKMS